MKQDRTPSPVDAQPVNAPAAAQVPATATVTPEAPAKPPRRKKVVLGTIALLALVGGGYEAMEWWTTGRFMVGTDDAYVQADITLISSRVQGYAQEILVSDNDHVKAGDVLVRLEDGDYRVALKSAQSRVETAGRSIERIEAQTEAARATVEEARASQQAAEAQYQNAKTNFDRTKDLRDRKVAAQAQLDSATEDLATATANLAKAKAAVASATAQVSVLEAQHAEAESQRHELELAVEQAQRDLDLTVLRAPADGVIANLAMEQGDLVSPGARLAALVADGGLYVEANFKETQMAGIHPGAHVHISFDALPDQEFEGVVESAAPATGSVFSLLPPDNATGNFTKIIQRVPVRISVPAEAAATGQLRAGLSVEVEVDSRTHGADAHQMAYAN